ncbi:uncharacterized protein [Musca autumnalis]|uniref:uncharacterized protein n=1 Tax=Musca autumnalis TaxID=221902 RepID=UPI003CF6D783
MHFALVVLLIVGNFPIFLNAYNNHQVKYDTPSPEWIRYQQERHHPKYNKHKTAAFGISTKYNQQQQQHNSTTRPGVIDKHKEPQQQQQQAFSNNFETTSRKSGIVDSKGGENHEFEEEVEYIDEVQDNTEAEQKTEDESNNANNELKYPSIQGFLSFLKSLKQTWIKHSLFRIEDKIKFLYNLRDNLLRNIERQFTALWSNYGDDDDGDGDEDDVNEGRKHVRHKRGILGEASIDFPPEAALMSINFLTFAVFLIKLVLQVVNIVRSKHITISSFGFNTNNFTKG